MTPIDAPEYAVYALRYAEVERSAPENLLGAAPDEGPMAMDYFFWAIVGGGRAFVVDTGFDLATAAARGRTFLAEPGTLLEEIGVPPRQVEDVVLTHLHYDHAGNDGLFPAARYHVQDREMAYVTGRLMGHRYFRAGYAVEDVKAMVDRVYAGRAVFHDGDGTLAPGLTCHLIGGHSAGLMALRVWTRRGWLVIASDAVPFYANAERGLPFPAITDAAEMLEGHRRILDLAGSWDRVATGHDPLTRRRWPASAPGLEGRVMRLDADPLY